MVARTQTADGRRGWVRRPIFYGLAIFGVIAGVALLGQGQRISSLSLNPSSGTVEVGFAAGAETEEVRASQADLAGRSDAAAQEVRSQAAPAGPQTPGIAGTWTTPTGLTYVVQQYGTGVVVQEHSAFGLSGVGQGQLQGNTAQLTYQAADGSFGQGTLNVAPDGSRIDATFANALTGQTSSVRMFRSA